MLSLEVLRRARLDGYQGGKSALYALVASLRPRLARPMGRFEGLPGEFVQHDFDFLVPSRSTWSRPVPALGAAAGHLWGT